VIDRYSRPEMVALWMAEKRYATWLEIEILACEARAARGEIPREALADIRGKARFEVKRIEEIEREVKHDVIAFLTNVGEYVGPAARFIHLGMTSSDVLDTGLAVQLRDASLVLAKGLERAMAAARKLALRYAEVPMIGRTHGIHAEPITFGLKAASWFAELTRRKLRRSAHRSVTELEAGIRTWISEWNKDPRPFILTKTADEILETLAAYCERVIDSRH